MSQQKSGAAEGEVFAEADVAAYLRSHPDFFERHTPLLLRLKLPHHTGSATVSLVERQVAMLRQRNGELERQLKDLVAVAKANNTLVENIHHLSLKLLSVDGLDAKLEQLENSLREDFAAEHAALILFKGDVVPQIARAGFVRQLDPDDPGLRPFASFLRTARPRCGTLRDRQKELLFAREADSIVSAAMVPLGAAAKLGFLAIGSRDPDHFHPGKRMDFLGRIGELIAIALESEYVRHRRQ
jgi:uncharacterized protein YigA (DUF484 family)